MNCKCGNPVEVAIEGELFCISCWSYGEMDDEARMCDASIHEYEEDQKTESKCPDCGAMSTPLEWKWDVKDMIMDCPNCGMWRLFAREAGRRPMDIVATREMMQYEHEQHELAKIYHVEEDVDTW